MEDNLELEFNREDLGRLLISKIDFLGNHYSSYATFVFFTVQSRLGKAKYKELYDRFWNRKKKRLLFPNFKSVDSYIKERFSKPEIKERYKIILKSFLSTNYEPPNDLKSIFLPNDNYTYPSTTITLPHLDDV